MTIYVTRTHVKHLKAIMICKQNDSRVYSKRSQMQLSVYSYEANALKWTAPTLTSGLANQCLYCH